MSFSALRLYGSVQHFRWKGNLFQALQKTEQQFKTAVWLGLKFDKSCQRALWYNKNSTKKYKWLVSLAKFHGNSVVKFSDPPHPPL